MLWFCRDLCSFGGEGVVHSVMGICAFLYMSNLFVVEVVLLRSMPDWRRRWSQSVMDICAFFYMSNLFGCIGFAEISARLEEKV